jgi:hypothetical protein
VEKKTFRQNLAMAPEQIIENDHTKGKSHLLSGSLESEGKVL